MFQVHRRQDEKKTAAEEFDETSMNAATSWTAVTSEAIHRFRVGES